MRNGAIKKTPEPVYLISAHIRHRARRVADLRNLKPSQWVYVPYERIARQGIISTCTVSHECYLIGAFSDLERGKLIQRP